MDILSEDVVALAGVFQAATLVRQTATQGDVDPAPFRTCIDSVFTLDAESAVDVFGGLANLGPGLRALRDHLGRRSGPPNAEITGYVIALMFLERKLVRSPSMLDALRRGIGSLNALYQTSPTDPEVISALAQLYTNTVSRLNPRILVHGSPEHLNENETADRIRALLLAGMRATVLWRQVGGGRLRLLFGRKRAAAAAGAALERMQAGT